MKDTWTHQYKTSRTISYYKSPANMRVTAGLHALGEQRPYFSVTAEIIENRHGGISACGCMHEEVLKHFPSLAKIVALHLSDDDGKPMHAKANGWYWLAGFYGGAYQQYHGGSGRDGRSQEECLRIFADLVRLPISEATTLAEKLRMVTRFPNTEHVAEYPQEWREVRTRWAKECKDMEFRWKAEADEGIGLLDSLIEAKQ